MLTTQAAAGGTLSQLHTWWSELQKRGPLFGYFPEPSKTWLITKPSYFETAKVMFPDIKITVEGHKYLGSFIGSDEGKCTFVENEVKEWITDIKELARIAKSEPQLAYAAYVYGTSKRWSFLCRTTPDVAAQMKLLEHHIKETLIPPIIGRDYISDESRRIFSLPARLGGLGFLDPSLISDIEYECSLSATLQLTEAIYSQQRSLNIDKEALSDTMKSITKKKNDMYKELQGCIKEQSSETIGRILELAAERGASSWLTSLPLKRYGFLLNKQEWQDAICLRYDFKIKGVSKTCVCGEDYSVNHCLTCKKGGYVTLRHNSLRDLSVEILGEICQDVGKEPHLLPVTGEQLPTGSNIKDGARLDVSARGIWAPLARAFLDIRVFNPQAQTNRSKPIPMMYSSHENQKKREYNARVLNIEKGTFTPVVFSTSGGMGQEAEKLLKQMANKISTKRKENYCYTISFLRRRYRFDLLRTCVIALRGYRGSYKPDAIQDLDLNLQKSIY